MWHFASNAFAGMKGHKIINQVPTQAGFECLDDEASSCTSGEEGLECPICWESFNIVENVPYVLLCGHTLCKNCVLGLQWAVVKFPSLPIQLPLFVSCPWCSMLSFRLVYRGNLKFPRKNFLLLWMVESMNGNRGQAYPHFLRDLLPGCTQNIDPGQGNQASSISRHFGRHCYALPEGSRLNHDHVLRVEGVGQHRSTLHMSLAVLVHLTAKFALIVFLLLIVLYAIPVSAAILALYVLATVIFALPSFLILYFAYPSLGWLVREIIS